MTWRNKVQGIVAAGVFLGMLALAGGAGWVDWLLGWVDSFAF
ncbi:MAG TPA: hypothetical protein VNA65_04465 [Candidatus Dormibacteraeota bacterium]|nr:hypothetical protein [Candidatus Dormibacteraeota bacterium]